MKAIKKNLENLRFVGDSITSVSFGTGSFVLVFINECHSTIRLFSAGRSSISSVVFSFIPSNYSFVCSFDDSGMYLTIWY